MSARSRIEISEYNAFTETPFAGNPAGVVTEAGELDDESMQGIARQLNLSETAFLCPASDPAADVRLRWFTPTREVTLCGHATIAAFVAAVDRGVFPVGEDEERTLAVETLAGRLRVRLHRRGRTRVWMQLPVPGFTAQDVGPERFADLWGVTADALAGPIHLYGGLRYWYTPVRDLETLRALRLDADRLAGLDPEGCFAFYCEETVEEASSWHLRFFAPFHGIPEDPVTGSAQGPMGALRTIEGPDPGDGWHEFRGEQGDHLRRPGRVAVRVGLKAGSVADLEIGGSAVRMLEGALSL